MMFINGKIMIWLNNLISKDDQMDKKMIGVKVQLPVNGHQDFEGTVVNRKRDSARQYIGRGNINPIMDTRIFTVKFGEDEYYDYSANVILENLYDQVDNQANSYSILKGILSHN